MSLTSPSAEAIRARRNALGLSQAAFAEQVGVSKRTVEEWEAGRNTAPPMLQLALNSLSPGPNNGVTRASDDEDVEAARDALTAVKFVRKHYASSAPGAEMIEDIVQVLATGAHNLGAYGGLRLNVADAISKAYLNRPLTLPDAGAEAAGHVINALLID